MKQLEKSNSSTPLLILKNHARNFGEPEIELNLISRLNFTKSQAVLSCDEDGNQIEPILDISTLNYTLFFPNLEEAQLLASQLKQLKDYLGLRQLPFMK